MENKRELLGKEIEKVFGGKKDKSDGSKKCDLCNKAGSIPLLNGTNICLDCLERLSKIVGEKNTFSLISSVNNPKPIVK